MREDDYSYENLKNFTYIDNVGKETTRVYGPVNNILYRMVLKDDYLQGISLKKNTVITFSMFGAHYS